MNFTAWAISAYHTLRKPTQQSAPESKYADDAVVSFDSIVAEIASAAAMKAVSLETELVAADAVLENLLAAQERTDATPHSEADVGSAKGLSDDSVSAVRRRAAPLAPSPMAEATILFVPTTPDTRRESAGP